MDYLSPTQLAEVTQRRDSEAWWIVFSDWALIAFSLGLAGLAPNPLTIILALFVVGCRQLSLGIIVHETGHQTFFHSKAVNDFVGRWLSGYWVFSSKSLYMAGHLLHHRHAGTPDDPDLKNYVAYPVSKDSFRRKVWRDLSGQTGWRRLKSIARSIKQYPALGKEGQRVVRGGLLTNGAFLILVTVLGAPWLFGLWVLAFITTHMLCTRIRQIGEHAGVPDLNNTDPRAHTRTVLTRWWERLFIAPHQIAFHVEHHLLPSVPIYQLPRLHRILRASGYISDSELTQGYSALIKQVTHSR